MDTASNQISELERKVDQLHHVVEHLSQQITVLVGERQHKDSPTYSSPTVVPLSPASPGSLRFNSAMEHKDVLVDEDSWEDTSTKQELSLDTQVRRLTAQLTAAYNRIAVLEEQLFDCRIHS